MVSSCRYTTLKETTQLRVYIQIHQRHVKNLLLLTYQCHSTQLFLADLLTMCRVSTVLVLW